MDHEFKADPNICTVCGKPRREHRHDYIPSLLASRQGLCWTCGKPENHELHSPSEGLRRELMIATYRKKPVEIQAIQWDGENTHDVIEFVTGERPENPFEMAGGCWLKQKVIDPDATPVLCHWYLVIPTLEGDHEAAVGDWIIRGVKGEHYPCKPDIFAATYDKVA